MCILIFENTHDLEQIFNLLVNKNSLPINFECEIFFIYAYYFCTLSMNFSNQNDELRDYAYNEILDLGEIYPL